MSISSSKPLAKGFTGKELDRALGQAADLLEMFADLLKEPEVMAAAKRVAPRFNVKRMAKASRNIAELQKRMAKREIKELIDPVDPAAAASARLKRVPWSTG